MNYFAFSALLNLITSTVLFIMMMAKSNRTKYDNWFAGFCFATMVWSTGYFFWQLTASKEAALFWTRFLMAGATIVGLTYLQFVLAFLGLSESHKKIVRTANIVYAIFFLLNFGPWIVLTVEPRSFFNFWPVPGFIFHIFLAVWGLSVVYSTYLLDRAYVVAQGLKRKQISLLFFGMAIAFICGSSNYFLWYNINIPPYLNAIVTIYPILIFYAIARYKFFNIKIIAAELFTLVLVSGSVWEFFIGKTNLYVMIGVLVLIVVAGITLIRSVIREVQQREELEVLTTKLKAANEQLKVLDQARAEFITIASHQLRTPPATIKWYLAAILDGDYGKFDDNVKDQLRKTMSTNNSMIALIDDLLNVSRIERGKMEFIFQATDLVEITQITIDQLLPQAEMRKLSLTLQKPTEPLPVITADKEKLRQVVNNLIDNAIKYTQKGGIIVDLSQTKKDLIVKVIDTGKGITAEQIKHVFEKFDRGKNAATHSTGLGLGLYVAKVIVEQHKGKIWAESKGEGKGSSFIFTVPIKGQTDSTVFDLTKSQKPAA